MEVKDIRKNDVVRISKEVTVDSLGTTGFYDTRGKFYPVVSKPEVIDGYMAELVRRSDPEGFPIQIGDVWQADDGKEWYIFSVRNATYLRAMTTPHDGDKATNRSLEEFKPKAVKLMHRREA